MPTTRKDIPHGCLVGGSWGQYATAQMLHIANIFGYDNMDALNLATRHLNQSPTFTDSDHELLLDYADKAEDWLNEHVAHEHYAFGWLDGEFYYLTKADWNGEI